MHGGGFGVGLVLVVALLAGLALAVAWCWRMARFAIREARPMAPAGARPADGKVHVWPMRAIVARPLAGPESWQVFEGWVDSGPERPGRDLPSRNLPLLGHVALISVFVGRDGRSWTDREVAEGHRAVAAAGRWLEREAARLGALLNVGLADACFVVDDSHDEPVRLEFVPEGDDYGPMEADAAVKGMASASRVAARLGCRDVADLVARVNARVEADAHAWLFHVKRRGRSHAIPVGDRVVRGVGIAFCYSREASFPEPLTGPARVDPATVAHELMHLFGATDKYGVPLDDFPAGTVPRLDIMRLDDDRLERLRVGKLTAREVGWPVSI